MTSPATLVPSTKPFQPALYDLDATVTVTFTASEAEEVRYGIHLARIAILRKALNGPETVVEVEARLIELYAASKKLGTPPRHEWENAVRRHQPLPTRRSA